MTFRSAAELASRPELMEPPVVLVPPIAVAGRVTLLTHPPKGGKSTSAAAMITEGSRRGIRCGLLTLDEALADSLQRLHRFGATLDLVYLSELFEPNTLEEEIATLDIQFLAVDHLGKLAELSSDFGAGSQGDPVLWGRLMAPFAQLARDMNLSVLLIDQARRSDGKYAGSFAKAGTVDLLCELQAKDGGLVGTPKGRITLPAFRVDLDSSGCPVFTASDAPDAIHSSRLNVATTRDRAGVLAALQSAEPEGLRATQWQSIACERTGVSRSTFFELRRSLYQAGLVCYTSKLYRVSPAGERAIAGFGSGNGNGH